MPNAPAHTEIHTHNYEVWVATSILDATSEAMLRARLVRLRALLRDGNQPAKVTEAPGKAWGGRE